MKQIEGIWLPDEDVHFEAHLKASSFEGKGAYQLKKIMKALEKTEGRILALDIGGHVGLWSRVLAYHFCGVAAFEPVPKLCACFKKNLKDHSNVILHECALGDKFSKRRMIWMGENTGNCRFVNSRPVDGEETGDLETDCKTLDSFNMNPDLIKIDVEGFEYFVLLGAEETIRQNKPTIVVEQKHDNATRYGVGSHDAVKTLQQWGARIYWVSSGDFCLGWN
jgi:FkbM family methyltransferase